MRRLLLILPLLLIPAAAPAQEDEVDVDVDTAERQPTFFCGTLGPPAASGVVIFASNPAFEPSGERIQSRAWSCTVTCAFRTSDEREFSSFTCTRRVRLGADNEEICRDGPGLVGAPFSDQAISTASCE